jgi:hypothetical protein
MSDDKKHRWSKDERADRVIEQIAVAVYRAHLKSQYLDRQIDKTCAESDKVDPETDAINSLIGSLEHALFDIQDIYEARKKEK